MTIVNVAEGRPDASFRSIVSDTPGHRRPRRMVGTASAVCAAMLVAYALPAYSQQSVDGSGKADATAAPMTMGPTGDKGLPVDSSDGKCRESQAFDAGMNMCMPATAQPGSSLMFRANQFAAYSGTSGPRGQSRTTGPGLWMLMFDTALSPRNRFRVDVMGSLEQLTVGDRGTPQLLQTENLDAMHAHDTIMGLEFRDVMDLGPDGRRQLTLLFAPRGAASYGPVPFMHRQSAEGNPDAPLGHDFQDGLHDVSTVLGVAYRTGATTFEATAFSGSEISWPFPLHGPDSFALRLNHDLFNGVTVGASFADVLLATGTGSEEHDQFSAAWIATSQPIGVATLKTSLVWGRHKAGSEADQDSFLAEAVYSRGRNSFYGRAESLQITPGQLDIAPAPRPDAKWVQAVTLGYERNLMKRDGVALYLGGSYTLDIVPQAFQGAYGGDPHGEKIYARIVINGASLIGF